MQRGEDQWLKLWATMGEKLCFFVRTQHTDTPIVFAGKSHLLDRILCCLPPGDSHAVHMPQEGEFAINGDIALPGLLPVPPIALQIEGGNVRQPLVAEHRLDGTPGNFMTSHGMGTTI